MLYQLNGTSNPMNKYWVDDTTITEVSSECDLGILTNSLLCWDEYIRSAIAKANSTIAWVSRNVISRSADVMLLIYKSLVRPLIEYCVQVWSTIATVGNWQIILELKNIQRRFTRLIDDMGLLPYTERLSKLKLTILAERRSRADLIEAYKIVGGSVSYGSQLLRISRSGTNRISKAGPDNKSNIYLLSESNKVLECITLIRKKVYKCG